MGYNEPTTNQFVAKSCPFFNEHSLATKQFVAQGYIPIMWQLIRLSKCT